MVTFFLQSLTIPKLLHLCRKEAAQFHAKMFLGIRMGAACFCVHMLLELLKLERDVTFFSKCVLDDTNLARPKKRFGCTFALN